MALLRSENGFVVVLSRHYLFAQTVGEIFFISCFVRIVKLVEWRSKLYKI